MDWATKEFMSLDLGDKRLNKRCASIAFDLGCHPVESIPVASKGFAETIASYRFFDNEKVNAGEILGAHKESVISRMQGSGVILLLQDTTELDYSSKQGKIEGLGVLNVEKRKGIYLHTVYAVTEERIPLGIVSSEFHKREKLKEDKSSHKSLNIEDKESKRWLDGFRIGCEIAKEVDSKIVVVGDRESDIFEIFSEHNDLSEDKADFIVRGQHNRRLLEKEGEKYIKERLINSPPKGLVIFKLRGENGVASREVELVVYAQELTPRVPPRPNGRKLSQAKINCIILMEENPPEGVTPIEWFLITSLPIKTIEEVQTVVRYYLSRWEIEVFFRTLKTGCKIEELQLEHIDRLEPCIALYMVIAWHVMYLTMLGRACPDISCDAVFEDYEWKIAWSVATKEEAPATPPSLQKMITIIAKFGGYLNRSNDLPPVPKAMWIGMQKLRNYIEGFRTYEEVYGTRGSQPP